MEVLAKLKFLRMSPRKVRLVADAIRGIKVDQALARLNLLTKAASRPVLKLLESAIANAEHNFKLEGKNLFVKKIFVDGGPMLKRFKPRAFGRGAPIHRHTSHITIVLDSATLPKAKGAIKAAVIKEEKATPAKSEKK